MRLDPLAIMLRPREGKIVQDVLTHLGEECALHKVGPERVGALVTCMVYLTALEYEDPAGTLDAMAKVAKGALALKGRDQTSGIRDQTTGGGT